MTDNKTTEDDVQWWWDVPIPSQRLHYIDPQERHIGVSDVIANKKWKELNDDERKIVMRTYAFRKDGDHSEIIPDPENLDDSDWGLIQESTMQDNPLQDENELKNNNGEDEISYEVRADCPMCNGTGKVDGEECTVCDGGGKIDIGENLPNPNTNFYQWWESLQPEKRQEIANSVGTLDEVGNKDWTQLHIQDQQAIHAKYIRDGGENTSYERIKLGQSFNLDGTPYKHPTCPVCGAKSYGERSNYCEQHCPHGKEFEIESDPNDGRYGMCYGCGKIMYGYESKAEELDLDKWLEEQEKQDKLQKAWDLRDAEKFLNEENFGKPYDNEDIPGEILINQNITSDTPFNEVDANNMEDGSNTSDFVNGGDADYKDIKGEATPTDSERWDTFTYTQKWDSIKPLQVTFSLSEDEIQTMAKGRWEDLPPAMKHELSLTGYNPENEDLYSQENLEKCKNCNGEGSIPVKNAEPIRCGYCHGTGKIDPETVSNSYWELGEAGPADITMDLDNGKGKVDKRRDIDTSQSEPNLDLQNTIEQLSGGDEQMTDFVGSEGTLEKIFGNGSQLNYCKFCNSTEDFRSGACARCQKAYSK